MERVSCGFSTLIGIIFSSSFPTFRKTLKKSLDSSADETMGGIGGKDPLLRGFGDGAEFSAVLLLIVVRYSTTAFRFLSASPLVEKQNPLRR